MSVRKRFGLICRLLRVSQYTKNGFVFLPLFFSGRLFYAQDFIKTLAAFAAFCCLASVIYILNDLRDREEDRHHPVKKLRPLASGEVSTPRAMFVLALLIMHTFIFARFSGSLAVGGVLAAYAALNIFYIYYAKQRSLLDVACIAVGFVLRTMAGGLAIDQQLSQWLVLMVFLLCMFLGLGKRWDDVCLSESGQATGVLRKSLKGYSRLFILSAMTFLSAVNTLCYVMYTLDAQTQARYGSPFLYLTSLWVIMGNLRFLQIAFVDQKTMSPTKIMLHDRGIQTCVIMWILHLMYLLYFAGK